jgi:hypothetical protein
LKVAGNSFLKAMLAPSDIIHLPYTSDLSEAGAAYACRSLASMRERLDDSPLDHLRRVAGGVAVELSFRRYLTRQAVRVEVVGAAPFTHPDQYDITLGGHRCIVTTCLISRRKQISWLRREPKGLLQAPALIPLDRFASEEHKPDDLHLFAFLLGVVAAARSEVAKAVAANQPIAQVHLLPDAWSRPATWLPFENLAMKSESATPIAVEIGGLDTGRNFIAACVELPPRQRMEVKKDFYSLAYLRVNGRPQARIGIHSRRIGEPYIIPVYAWGNIWVYGMEILITGWLTHADFRSKASVVNAGSLTFPGERTREKNLMVPVSGLNPLDMLLKKVKIWEQEQKSPIKQSY